MRYNCDHAGSFCFSSQLQTCLYVQWSCVVRYAMYNMLYNGLVLNASNVIFILVE